MDDRADDEDENRGQQDWSPQIGNGDHFLPSSKCAEKISERAPEAKSLVPAEEIDRTETLRHDASHALNFLIGLEVANADERPARNPDDYFGRTFGRKSR
jgi:hypothetical protein